MKIRIFCSGENGYLVQIIISYRLVKNKSHHLQKRKIFSTGKKTILSSGSTFEILRFKPIIWGGKISQKNLNIKFNLTN